MRAGSSPAVPEVSSVESAKSVEEGREEGGGCCCCCGGGIVVGGLGLFRMSKAMARSGVIRVCDRGMSSSGGGSCSSHLENQFESSSLIFFVGGGCVLN